MFSKTRDFYHQNLNFPEIDESIMHEIGVIVNIWTNVILNIK
jgi:hypothetical protein